MSPSQITLLRTLFRRSSFRSGFFDHHHHHHPTKHANSSSSPTFDPVHVGKATPPHACVCRRSFASTIAQTDVFFVLLVHPTKSIEWHCLFFLISFFVAFAFVVFWSTHCGGPKWFENDATIVVHVVSIYGTWQPQTHLLW